MKRHWQYLKYVVRHKWFVFLACFKWHVPLWIAILHDWDKFLPDEWFPYAECFYKPDGTKQYVESEAFTRAWNFHQKRNKHHWQFWLITWDRGVTDSIPMPDLFIREMLADWDGAGRAITGKSNTLEWYSKQRGKIKLHPETQIAVETYLGYHEAPLSQNTTPVTP